MLLLQRATRTPILMNQPDVPTQWGPPWRQFLIAIPEPSDSKEAVEPRRHPWERAWGVVGGLGGEGGAGGFGWWRWRPVVGWRVGDDGEKGGGRLGDREDQRQNLYGNSHEDSSHHQEAIVKIDDGSQDIHMKTGILIPVVGSKVWKESNNEFQKEGNPNNDSNCAGGRGEGSGFSLPLGDKLGPSISAA
ncbi:hypothetical protein IEQ34_014094 [Dendrobium chrysotoxum]|uniref:Uncharacterized protein n=1 Tax=Dendrobium chrysotoxum TaxID=161865 RepID=A0AAV7GJR6_DENCH|nr:hypothetical protein IEQ34_014094 [Dendrobium chrysotoxum]